MSMNAEVERRSYDHFDDEQPREKAALGISFSGQNIFFAEVVRLETSFMVRKFGTIATNMKFGTGIEGVEKNIRDLYSYVNGCIEDNAIKARKLNLSMNSQLIALHRILIEPGETDVEFENQVKWEIGQQILDDVDQFIVNTHELHSGATSLTPVLVVGVRRRFIDTLNAVLEKSKISLACVDMDILCAHATYEMNYNRGEGLTALVETKPGIAAILICNGYEIEYVYQMTSSAKSVPARLGALINQHLDNALNTYKEGAAIERVILCNAMATAVLPHIEQRFNAEVINPFSRIRLADELIPKPVESDESDEEKETKETQPNEIKDYSPYAECVGAAVKLLAD